MAKAAPAEQIRLLDVAALDSQATKINREITEATADAQLAAADSALEEATGALTEVQVEVAAAAGVLKESERAVEKVVAHIAKDQSRIDAGAGTHQDMMALSHEIDSLTIRRNELEDTELEHMTELEEVQERAAEAQALVDTRTSEQAEHLARRDAALAALRQQLAENQSARATLAATFDEGLITTYERLRTRNGIGAARLFHGVSEASGMALAAGDLGEIKAAPADELVFCPDTGAILVRSEEWGA